MFQDNHQPRSVDATFTTQVDVTTINSLGSTHLRITCLIYSMFT